MYFIIFKKHKEDKYRHYTNEIFSKEEDAISFADRSFTRKHKGLWKIVDYKKFTNPVKKIGLRPLLRLFTDRYYLVFFELGVMP